MRLRRALPLVGIIALSGAAAPPAGLPVVQPNPNLERAGVLRAGVLTVRLEAREALWHLNGAGRPPMTIEVFSERGKPPLMPGPLLRVPQGTEVRLSVRNSLRRPLTFLLPAELRGGGGGGGSDSLVVAPGAVGTLSTRAAVPGNYLYRATTPNRASRELEEAGLLAGAFVVDTAGAAGAIGPARDRVFVIMETGDSAFVAYADTATREELDPTVGRFVFSINGRSWPGTERLSATVGDSLHWRIINASDDVHPMHLHGFYYRIDGMSGPLVDLAGRPAPGQLAVTQLLVPFGGMSMTWFPTRPGNWIFHCHFALHLMPDSVSAAPDDPHMRAMVGLVLAIAVADRPGVPLVRAAPPARRLRLIALGDTAPARAGVTLEPIPPMRFVLEENGRRLDAGPGLSPEIDLVRGEPVAITVVNRLAEPTSVHWHGIEIEDSYVDGVPGVSGAGKRLSPAIAPGDSFVARFTPPRAGTFMYHAHVDEVNEQRAGLLGALVVREPGVAPSPDDHVFFLMGSRAAEAPLVVNGAAIPDTVVLHVGRPARLRFLNLSTASPVPFVWLTARPDSSLAGLVDTLVVRWIPVAKDGAQLPPAARTPRPAHQLVTIGETWDFEYTPASAGTLRLEVRGVGRAGTPMSGRLFLRVPIRVE